MDTHTIIDVCLLVSILDFRRDEPRMRTPLVLPSEGFDGGVGFGGGAVEPSSTDKTGLRTRHHGIQRQGGRHTPAPGIGAAAAAAPSPPRPAGMMLGRLGLLLVALGGRFSVDTSSSTLRRLELAGGVASFSSSRCTLRQGAGEVCRAINWE